jgi:hypothetical protein
MTSIRLVPVFLAFIALLASASPATVQSAAATLEARTSDADGVRVVVQPQTNAPVDGKWSFTVNMDTHVKPLTDNLMGAAVLVDDAGHRDTPIAWTGDAPGGHHRKGVLQFSFEGASAKTIELQMEGVGGTAKRVFQWQLN